MNYLKLGEQIGERLEKTVSAVQEFKTGYDANQRMTDVEFGKTPEERKQWWEHLDQCELAPQTAAGSLGLVAYFVVNPVKSFNNRDPGLTERPIERIIAGYNYGKGYAKLQAGRDTFDIKSQEAHYAEKQPVEDGVFGLLGNLAHMVTHRAEYQHAEKLMWKHYAQKQQKSKE